MFTPFCSADLSTLSIKDKRVLLTQLKDAIKADTITIKKNKEALKYNKEAEKRAKVLSAIKAAEEKLAKLNAKLAS